jgi:hypothetical protein
MTGPIAAADRPDSRSCSDCSTVFLTAPISQRRHRPVRFPPLALRLRFLSFCRGVALAGQAASVRVPSSALLDPGGFWRGWQRHFFFVSIAIPNSLK